MVSIRKARIVSVSGPWPCGPHSDLKIFRNVTRKFLVPNEFVIADNGYIDSRCIQPPGCHHFQHSIYSRIRSRREVVKKRLKQFSLLTQKFRHDVSYHGTCFHTIANITMLAFV